MTMNKTMSDIYLNDTKIKKDCFNVTLQAKAIRSLCEQYTAEIANKRYQQIMFTIKEDTTIATLIEMIGEAMQKEEMELEKEITNDLMGRDNARPVYFDSFRYCMTNSRELKTAVCMLLGW